MKRSWNTRCGNYVNENGYARPYLFTFFFFGVSTKSDTSVSLSESRSSKFMVSLLLELFIFHRDSIARVTEPTDGRGIAPTDQFNNITSSADPSIIDRHYFAA